MLDINLCPFCGGDGIVLNNNDFDFFVQCTKCGAKGPTAGKQSYPYPAGYPSLIQRQKNAIDLWNEVNSGDMFLPTEGEDDI